jgi:hydroxyacylglutathione hydrolase
MKKLTDGITMLNQYGGFKNACWILHHNGEAAVVEMPPYNKGSEKPPWEETASFVKKNKLFLKYAFLTHPHWDHCNTLPYFRVQFPQTHFVTHRSFLMDPYYRYSLGNVIIKNRHMHLKESQLFDHIFNGDLWTGNLGGEPVHIIHAPKHSYGDQLIIFKGAMITGDWFLGDLTDCNNLVKNSDKRRSINRVMELVRELNYDIHMLFSGHGDHLFYDADFFSVMEQSKVAHRGNPPPIKAHLAGV